MPVGTHLKKSYITFIEQQPMFFVATAPTKGKINVSPKGLDTLRVVSKKQLLWLNLSGSGNETSAHVLENQRITLMFCAFSGKPLILRVYGTASVLHPRDDVWSDYIKCFPDYAGARQMFLMTIEATQTSCGSGVPIFDLQEQRGTSELVPFYDELGPDGVSDYWRRKNQKSIDGLETGTIP